MHSRAFVQVNMFSKRQKAKIQYELNPETLHHNIYIYIYDDEDCILDKVLHKDLSDHKNLELARSFQKSIC